MGYQTVKSVEKAIAIIELLTSQSISNDALSLSDIAKSVGILPVTARNLLRTLEECGYANRVSHGRYREGDRCLKLFRREGVLRKLREVAAPHLEQTVEDLGESVLLVSIVNNRRVELLRCQTEDDKMVSPEWQANEDFYKMRTTRAILAWLSPRQIEEFVEACGLPSQEDWPECNNSEAGLKRELSRIRRAGGCLDVQAHYIAMAVPILTPANEVIASLGCYAIAERTDKARATGIMKLLHDCATTIREEMDNSLKTGF